MRKYIINNQRGFTLIEMIVVLAVLAVFITMMTSLLIVPVKIANSLQYENTGRSASTLLNAHLTQSIRKNGVEGALSIVDEEGFTNVLRIQRQNTSDGAYLYYFYNPADETIYFQTGNQFTPANLDNSMIIARQVKSLSFALGSLNKELKISIDAYQDKDDMQNIDNTKTSIALKAN